MNVLYPRKDPAQPEFKVVEEAGYGTESLGQNAGTHEDERDSGAGNEEQQNSRNNQKKTDGGLHRLARKGFL